MVSGAERKPPSYTKWQACSLLEGCLRPHPTGYQGISMYGLYILSFGTIQDRREMMRSADIFVG